MGETELDILNPLRDKTREEIGRYSFDALFFITHSISWCAGN